MWVVFTFPCIRRVMNDGYTLSHWRVCVWPRQYKLTYVAGAYRTGM